MQPANASRVRWPIIAAVYVCSAFYFLFQGGKTALMLFVILNLLLVYLLLGRWSGINRVNGTRAFTSQGSSAHNKTISAGSPLEVNLQVKVPGYYPVPYVIIRDVLRRHNGQLLQFEASFIPNWKRAGSVTYHTPALQRGEYRFANAECVTWDVFGLFEHTGSFPAEAVFSVLPQTVAIRQWSGFQRGVRGPYSHAAASRSAKETTQLNGVREYLYGDRLSRIHWNATAKTGEWKSKAFERESLPRTLLILDRHLPAYEGSLLERFELAVSVTASFMEHGLKDDTAMGLLSIGESMTYLPAKSGIEQRSLAMKHLTFVDADAPRSIYLSLQMANSVIEPGSFALLITGETGSSMLRSMEFLSRKGLTPCLIHVGSRGTRHDEGAGWQKLIRDKGWHAFEINQLQELPSILEGSGIA
ncbi:DUF58 domain-containing protein [Paenibacillus sp. HB172176]|uniref:DUF58 domain-containing protein n=1 Tax=Paenibacillus sp. HB172176 TaxID=2493690 RepID=UPI00143B483E|nr:DUF58 domain-containing protein [Paenibacillus sp. HB172176]